MKLQEALALFCVKLNTYKSLGIVKDSSEFCLFFIVNIEKKIE